MLKVAENSRRTFWLVVAAAFVLSSCTKAPVIGDGTAVVSVSTAVPSWTIPPGVFIPADRMGQSEIDGLYSSRQESDCCWLSPHALIRFKKRSTATHVDLTLVVSGMVPRYKITPPRVSIILDGTRLVDRTLPLGSTKITLPFAGDSRGDGPYEMHLTSSSFIPAREGITTDTRALGLILKKVETH